MNLAFEKHWLGPSSSFLVEEIAIRGVPWWLSGLRICCFHCYNSGHCHGSSLIPGPWTSTGDGHSQKRKKKKIWGQKKKVTKHWRSSPNKNLNLGLAQFQRLCPNHCTMLENLVAPYFRLLLPLSKQDSLSHWMLTNITVSFLFLFAQFVKWITMF